MERQDFQSLILNLQEQNTPVVNSNTAVLYPSGTGSVSLTFGVVEGGALKPLCKVELDGGYFGDGYGCKVYGSSPNYNGSMVVDLPNEKYYVNGKALYSAVGCVAPNGYSNDVYLTVYSGAKYQYEPIIKSFPGGISIGEGSAHPAYISDAVNGIDCSFVYDLDENNSLIATISGDLKNMLTLEEIAKELYKLITPVN